MIIQTAPNYIQKQIIKILCENIDKVNRGGEGIDDNDQIGIRNDVQLSLVNKFWFKTMSSFLGVSVNFKTYHSMDSGNEIMYRLKFQNQFKNNSKMNNCRGRNNSNILLQDENIKQLVIDHSKFPTGSTVTSFINDSIKSRYTNLQFVIIKNPSKPGLNLEFNQVIADKMVIRKQFDLNQSIRIVGCMIIQFDFLDNEYFSYFKSLYQIDKFIGSGKFKCKTLYDFLNIQISNNSPSRNGVNCLTNTKEITLYDNLSITDLYYLLKLSTNVSILKIQICMDNLIFKLITKGNLNIPFSKSCLCHPYRNGGTLFQKEWDEIIESLIRNNHLKVLDITHNCEHSVTRSKGKYKSQMFNSNTLELFDQFKQIIPKLTSLDEFYLNNITNHKNNDNKIDLFK